MYKRFINLSAIFTLILCLCTLGFGQETTGEIQGTVTDEQGAVVPNVAVTITGVNVGFNRTIQTDSDGFYRARQLPPGTYRVSTAAVSGFVEQTKNDVQVALGNATTLDFQLGTSISTVIDVTSDSGVIVDATETKAQDNISAREIDSLPKGTNFTSLIRTTASVRPEPLGGQYSINGATGPENSFIIDGQETQNFRNGLLNVNNDIPYQALQEIQVKTSGFEAEFGGATGGVINGVTKSGTNEYHGEFGMQFNTQKLNAAPRDVLSVYNPAAPINDSRSVFGSGQGVEYFRQTRDTGVNVFPTAIFSGPIVKDRLWFFAIHNPRYQNLERTTNFIQGFGDLCTGTPAFCSQFAPGRSPVTISPAVPALAGAQTTQNAAFKRTLWYDQIKLDATPTNSLRISSSFTYNPIVDEGNTLGGTFALTSPSFADFGNGNLAQGSALAAVQGGRQNSNNFRVEANYTPNNNLVTTLRYTRGFLNEKLGSYGVPSTTRIRCRSAGAFASIAGCATGFQNTNNNAAVIKDVSIRNTIDANASYLVNGFLGRHEFKGGYQFSKIENDVNSGTADNGGVTHLYYNRTTLTPTFLCNSSWSPYTTVAPPTLPAGVNVIGVGCNQKFSTKGQASNTANTFFVQDKWQPFSRLTLNLGVRTESEQIPAFNDSPTSLKFNYADKIAPRLGAAYALTGDGKTKISAFYGWFYDRLKFELPRGSFGGDFYHVDFFFITNDRPQYTFYTGPNIAGNFQYPIGGSCPAGGIPQSTGTLIRCDEDFRIPSNLPNSADLGGGGIDPDLKPYRQSEFTTEFQREVMRASVFTARYLHRNLDQAIEDAGYRSATGSESYIIGNPGQGQHAAILRSLGYSKIIKPVRRYNALQFEYDTRFVKNFSVNFNYTLSKLYGNYSGLASPDENGRSSPNVNRDFDLPFVGFTASGEEALGVLGLDRTHVFKASGTYSFDWLGSKTNSTDVSFFTTAQSGLPQTTFVTVFGIPIPETKRNDLGRTEKFTQTDLNFTHRYRFGRDDKFSVAFDVNLTNIFNENNVLGLSTSRSSAYYNFDESEIAINPTTGLGDLVVATNTLTSGGILTRLRASEATFDPLGTGQANFFGNAAATNQAYKLPNTFQEPRSVRFGFRFLF
jgi:outer membrane receptor protein involved in Fe transport